MKPLATILAATDLSNLGQLAVDAAADFGRHLGARRLVLLNVVSESPSGSGEPFFYSEEEIASARNRAVRIAEQRLSEIEPASEGVEVERMVRCGIPAFTIATVAETLPADLVVVSSHGYGAFRRAVLGSVAGALIRVAPCPVFVVGSDRTGRGPVSHVLAAVDLSPASNAVLETAHQMTPPGGRLSVVSVYEPPFPPYGDVLPATPYARSEQARAHQRATEALVAECVPRQRPIDVEVLGHLGAAQGVLERIEQTKPDLCVIGTSGRNAWKRFIVGSTATKVIAAAQCPVLVVPHEALLTIPHAGDAAVQS